MISVDSQRNRLIENYVRTAVKDQRVVEAIQRVPRHEFVPEDYQAEAYQNRPLPIDENQTISQPSLVAQMTEALQLKPTDKVLEIGTGSGYQAAILAELAGEVFTVERFAQLAQKAEVALTKLGYENVEVVVGDGTQGLPQEAPFDAIIVTAAAPEIPQPLIDQLKESGRLVIPVGDKLWGQRLLVGTKENSQLKTRETTPVMFVPLIGQHGWQD